jgi:diguanylate cyclase (GGDEF)-like protein
VPELGSARVIASYRNRPALPEVPSLAPYRVLLVEDDPEYGRMVERVLRRGRPPLRVHREERLDVGLRRLERDHYDAIVVDLKLPDAAGRSTLERACAVAGHVPVVVLTGTDDDSLALDAIRAGAQDYLVKQRTHALSLPGVVLRAIERQRHNHVEDAQASEGGPPHELFAADELQLLDHLARALARARRRREPVAVMVLGYDDLDWVEQTFDAAAVERLVARASARLALCVRRSDILARLDGNRFALVVEGARDRSHLQRIAEGFQTVMQSLETQIQRGLEVAGLVARVGISVHPEEGDDPETLLENAALAWDEASPHGGIGFYGSASR